MKNDKLYLILADILRTRSSTLAPGQALGTEMGFVKEFGYSRTTVRRAIDELVAEGVLARRAGVGVAVAKRAVSAGSQNLLVLVRFAPEEDEIFMRMTMGVVDTANHHGYQYHILRDTDERQRLNKVKNLNLGEFSGAVMSAFDCEADREILAALKNRGVPVVLIDNPLEGGIFSYVAADDYAGGYELGQHLGELGHKRVMYFRNIDYALTVENRRRGLCDSLETFGAKLVDSGVNWHWPRERDVVNFVKTLLTSPNRSFTAIACSNDMLAYYVLKACAAMNISVPEELSVSGYGDYRVATQERPAMTTVRTSGYRMGEEAVKLLVNHNLLNEPKKVILSVELLKRESTGTPRGAAGKML